MEAIRFENISKVYKEGNMTFTALDNINMSVNSGEFVAVIGPSGSEKARSFPLQARCSNRLKEMFTSTASISPD